MSERVLKQAMQHYSVMAESKELKERLWKLVKTIVDSDDDYSLQTTDDAIATLSSLKDFKIKNKNNNSLSSKNGTTKSFSHKFDHFAPPSHFLCPISSQLMIDPVILSTGQVLLFLIGYGYCSVFYYLLHKLSFFIFNF